MNIDDYQERTKETAFGVCTPTEESEKPDGETVTYLALALGGETGEAQEKVKKYIREGDEEYLEDLKYELGDILWYFARLADELDMDLSDVARDNLAKLGDRQDRDALTGEGDDR